MTAFFVFDNNLYKDTLYEANMHDVAQVKNKMQNQLFLISIALLVSPSR